MSAVATARTPATKPARLQAIVRLIEHHEIHSQGELADLLAAEGVNVTQATLSRDLLELDASKVRSPSGAMVYSVPPEGHERRGLAPVESEAAMHRLERLCGELVLTADASANLVVLRTPPGAAQFLASALDKVDFDDVLGTIAGDDTVMMIARDPLGGPALVRRILDLASHA